jgi:MoaA/NifB/PqqE/SkfB family radical SAM enzyme
MRSTLKKAGGAGEAGILSIGGAAMTGDQRNASTFWTCGLERMVFFNYDHIKGCCANLKTGDAPHLGDYGPGGSVDIDQIVNAKRAHLAAVRRGEQPKACEGCTEWVQNEWPDSPYLFNDVNIGHFTACNTDCYYCRSNSNSAPKPVSARASPRLLAVLKQMVERGHVDPEATIRFGGGEPTLHPEFEDTVDYFISTGHRFFLNSSGVKYSAAIERMLRNTRSDSRLVISIDSASNETYKVIKRFDVGGRVWDNIARYAQAGPDILEVKYIVLPENSHETGDFVRRCHALGVGRVSFDLDAGPVMGGVTGSVTDEIVDGIAVMIHEAKQRRMSVFHSGSGGAAWQFENGHARVERALCRIAGRRVVLNIGSSGFVSLTKPHQKLRGGIELGWGRHDDVNMIPLNSEPGAVYLQEGTGNSRHGIEQGGIEVTAQQPYTLEVIARPAGRSRLMVELRDAHAGGYTRAKYDLAAIRITEFLHDNAAIGALDEEWVSCQLTFTPQSPTAIVNLTLIDEVGVHSYQGAGTSGVYLRPLLIHPPRSARPWSWPWSRGTSPTGSSARAH